MNFRSASSKATALLAPGGSSRRTATPTSSPAHSSGDDEDLERGARVAIARPRSRVHLVCCATTKSRARRALFVKLRMVLLCAVAALAALLAGSAAYSNFISRSPCDVAAASRAQILARGSAPRIRSNGEEFSPHVPKTVHQQWKTDDGAVPDKYASWHAAWKLHFPEPEYTHVLWTDASARALIAKHYSWFLAVYDGYPFNIQRADAARYFVLHHEGGIYADLDYEPAANFWDLIPKDRAAVVESPYRYNERVQNSLMSSPRGDPFWEDVFATLLAQARAPVLQSTGPKLLDLAMARTMEAHAELPCENFHRIPLGELAHSPAPTLLHRELLGRWWPMKSCGDFGKDAVASCQLGKHHNTAGYLSDTGILKLLF